jgi:carboxyl-terminal processing protease
MSAGTAVSTSRASAGGGQWSSWWTKARAAGKEVVTYGLKRHGVRVVGTRTAGALLAGRGFLLRDGSLLVLAVSDVRVEGERLEGRGVMPDVVVPFRLPYAAGHDPQLEAALAERAQQS